ncbi:MAG: 2-oxoacid:acceptor oxidoreductase subunit alpha [Candidatus Omnitrophica bacterium]|nr:2-oxoacid:acceptor oxidoreductase subunit alpha [Candidatus Omnitrophota bacterium]
MIKNNMTIKIGGEAGMGVESGGAGLTKALTRGGLYVFANQDYMSRIRGGHNFFQLRVSTQELKTFTDDVHLLLAFTKDCIERHKHEIVKGGAILYDEALSYDAESIRSLGAKACPVPFSKLATEIGGHRIMSNTCAMGAAFGITGYAFERVEDIIKTNFKKKGEDVVAKNLAVAKAGYDFAQEQYSKNFDYKLEVIDANPTRRRMVLHGNQAIGLGAIAAGCKFISAYPMTPATSIFEYITAKANQYGIVSKQTEDEIAAILFAIGANHAGVRAMTCTSGGGFSLMVEALGLASMTETPLVIAEVQRGGPSTGLPTRTEQPDLEFVISASQGEAPRIVIAPGTIEECFEAGWRAFNLAEKYQCPVIILSDLYLSSHLCSTDKSRFDFSKVKIDRGSLLTKEQLDRITDYKRHAITDNGISPRAIPGHPHAVFVTTSDEHTEYGYAVEDADLRSKMMEKRMKKLDLALQDMRAPELYGDKDADVTLVGWGSTCGSIREAVDRLRKNGQKINFLKFTDIWPFPEDKARPLLEKAKTLVAIENNYTGQLANVIRRCTGIKMDAKILKYSGRPFSPEEIIANLKEEAKIHVKA